MRVAIISLIVSLVTYVYITQSSYNQAVADMEYWHDMYKDKEHEYLRLIRSNSACETLLLLKGGSNVPKN